MSGVPTIVQILRHLRRDGEAHTYEDIINETSRSQENVKRALAKLVESKIIKSEESFYRYIPTPEAEEFCQKLFDLYEKAAQKPRMELIVRGILSSSARHLFKLSKLLEVLEKEGFSSEDVSQLLEEDINKGCLRRLKLIFVTRFPFSPPIYMPSGHVLHFREVHPQEYKNLKEYSQSKGLCFIEEEYLQPNYPPELAEQGRRYLEKQARQILESLREEVFRQRYRLRGY